MVNIPVKKILLGIAGVIVFVFLYKCCGVIGPVHEGVLVSKFGSNRGANDMRSVTGLVFVNPFTEYLIDYSLSQHNYDLEPFQANVQGGTLFTLDPQLSYHLNSGQAANVYRRFNRDIDEIGRTTLVRIVKDTYRNISNKYTPDSLMNHRQQFEEVVQKELEERFAELGFKFEGITSNMTPPESLQQMINAKNTAVQTAMKIQNDVAAEKARAEIAITRAKGAAEAKLIEATAEAKAYQLKQQALTPLLIQQQWVQKWNGVLPATQLGGGTNTFYGIK